MRGGVWWQLTFCSTSSRQQALSVSLDRPQLGRRTGAHKGTVQHGNRGSLFSEPLEQYLQPVLDTICLLALLALLALLGLFQVMKKGWQQFLDH